MTALWMNFICELSVLRSGTIIRPTKQNDINTEGKKETRKIGKKEGKSIYTKNYIPSYIATQTI